MKDVEGVTVRKQSIACRHDQVDASAKLALHQGRSRSKGILLRVPADFVPLFSFVLIDYNARNASACDVPALT